MIYVISAHVAINFEGVDTYGPAHVIHDFLVKSKKLTYLIKHPLYLGGESLLIDNNGKKVFRKKNKNSGFVISSITHCMLNIKWTKKFLNKNIYFIGTDPVNSISGALLKLLGIVKMNVYFVADYADERFENRVLNFLYHGIDLICLKMADEVWCVSTRILNKRLRQGVDKNKLKLIPNSPFLIKPQKENCINHDLIIVSNLGYSLAFDVILDSMELILNSSADTRLLIIGSGPKEKEFRDMVKMRKLNKSVIFLGQKNHDEVLAIISKCYIGIALYTKEKDWNVYGDSMKAREYVACGLPVIINNIPSTADDIDQYQAGFVMEEINAEQIAQFVQKCLSDNKYYTKLRNNASKMADDFEKNKILNSIFNV